MERDDILWFDKSDGMPCHVKYYAEGHKEPWMDIKFQANPVKKVGRNGMCMLDVLEAMIKRLFDFEKKWPCKENIKAIEAMREAQMWMRTKRDRRKKEPV